MIKTYMKTAIALGLFSIAPLMNNVYAEVCHRNCNLRFDDCKLKCTQDYGQDVPKRGTCDQICYHTYLQCWNTCK